MPILNYDGEIEKEGFEIIAEGEYFFEVMKLERKRGTFKFKNNGIQETVEDCPNVEVTVNVFNEDGRTVGEVSDRLYMHSAVEWKLCQFFTSIGLRKHGEKFRMDWNAALHKKGCLKIKNTTQPSRNDPNKMITYNNVDKYLDVPTTKAEAGDDTPL